MAASAEVIGGAGVSEAGDEPRTIDPGRATVDRVFQNVARSIGVFVLALTGSIGLFLGYQAIPTLHRYGLRFFTESQWLPRANILGLSAVLVGTAEVALIALGVGFPLALLTALYISEYSPPRLRPTLVALVDLMAGVPSIVFGLWAVFLLEPRAIYVSRWLSQYLGWIPIFKVDFDPNGAFLGSVLNSHYGASALIAGIAVSMMVIPLACSVMRSVFAQAPLGEREGAMALGASRWGVIRAVVLPFGRRGIIGGTMLALGRALGETVAVLLIISPVFVIKAKILTTGTITTSALIATYFGEATSAQLSALLAAGFVLFLLTLAINTLAAVLVNRSRSGAEADI
jgi:phosphate transport system permease protein